MLAACLSVSVQRVFSAEVGRATGQHRVTLFLDLTTFFETVDHERLAATADEVQFPATLLNIALQVYRGARVLDAASSQSPPPYPTQGVVAGCPIAPCLFQLALHKPCLEAYNSSLAEKMTYGWMTSVPTVPQLTPTKQPVTALLSFECCRLHWERNST